MAKVAKGGRNAQSNPRSRAARRANSPSLDTDKSLKEVPRAESPSSQALAPFRGNGILKKKKVKQMSRGQRVRHEKILARAEIVQEQLENKVNDFKSRQKKRQGRRAQWDEVNEVSKDETRKTIKGPGRFGALDGEDEEDDMDAADVVPFYGDTEIKVIDGVQVPSFATGQVMTFTMGPGMQAPPRTIPAPTQATTSLVPETNQPAATEISAAPIEPQIEKATEQLPQEKTTENPADLDSIT